MNKFCYEDKVECWKDLNPDAQKILCDWICDYILPRKTPNTGHSSYGLKHIFKAKTGIYVYNGQFKAAMRLCGYEPVDENEQNWHYRISEKSPAFEYPRVRSFGARVKRVQ